jgi:SAM-dependent MidA family methyltransferase
VCASACSVDRAQRHLQNPWDAESELVLAPDVRGAVVREHLPSFADYLDVILFHRTAGYYATGRVDFYSHYRTFPVALAPSFGQMLAEHVFRMWDGMRKAGTLGPSETFTIAEIGAGDGALAESILDTIDHRAAGCCEPAWTAFKAKTVYVSYDRSPALSEK